MTNMDILVLGATGFTGRLIVRYLFAHPQRDAFTLGVGARSTTKLDALVAELGLDDTVQRIQVDVSDLAQVEAAVTRARVVINAVGPYIRWGTPVVHACVKHGRHYVDLCGETHWMREIITKYDYYATKTGAIIIPSCGFDSMPSDISAFLSNTTVKEILGPDASIESSLTGIKAKGGMVSGGTFSTVVSHAEDIQFSELVASQTTQYFLSPVKGRVEPHRLFYNTPHSPSIHGALYIASSLNRAVVERTWGLHELELQRVHSEAATKSSDDGSILVSLERAKRLSYGPRFGYDEFVITPNVLVSLFVDIATVCIIVGLATVPIRWLIKRLGPKPGSGPSEEVMRNGYLETINVTTALATPDTPGIHVKSITRGKGDPAYSLTSVMISEAALSIALSYKDLPDLGRRGGLLTPMSALGHVLLDRLKASGRFEFESKRMDD